MKRMMVGAFVLISILNGCDSGPDCTKTVMQSALDGVDAAQLAIDNAIITDYIAANSLSGVQEVNGIKYFISKEGNGATPCLENNVVVSYIGKLMSNGTVFDKNLTGVSFKLNNLILGWQLSLPSFTNGTTATILIPSGYGYGTTGVASAGIPPNANLIFEITILNIR